MNNSGNKIKSRDIQKLYNFRQSAEFYEESYKRGYMDEWPLKKKQRVIEIIRGLQLPEKGDALDFGCGNGILTEIVRQVLPAWNVYGTDISITAIEHAKARYPDCCFFHLEDNHCKDKKFDFLFTNHVLEHVYSLQETLKKIVDFLKPTSFMLHLLPCGNKGSFEYRICLLNREGINRKMGNRFFFEDHSHLRRLTGAQLKDLAGERLAIDTQAEAFAILTDTDKVYLHYKTADQKGIDRMTIAEVERHLEEGTFGDKLKGSMGPKLKAAIRFIKDGGKKVVITTPALAAAALDGQAGTTIVP